MTRKWSPTPRRPLSQSALQHFAPWEWRCPKMPSCEAKIVTAKVVRRRSLGLPSCIPEYDVEHVAHGPLPGNSGGAQRQ